MEELQEKIKKMEAELVTYSDIDGLKEITEEKKRSLMTERQRLITRRDTSKRVLMELSAQYDTAKRSLEENETYNTLNALSKKWAALERNNYSMRQYINSKEVESNFKPYVKHVTSLIKEYNGNLRIRAPQKSLSTAM